MLTTLYTHTSIHTYMLTYTHTRVLCAEMGVVIFISQENQKVIEQRQIDFAWTIVDWRTFDSASPIATFPGDSITKAPSALELLVINLKNSPSSEVSLFLYIYIHAYNQL